jgi:signal transduction histidine kinase
LLENALRYARDQVTLSVLAGERTVDITVSDDGPGVDAEGCDRESLFAAGVKASASPGAGLGLALARRVAHTLGGDVSLTSPRDPTSFTLTLPRP